MSEIAALKPQTRCAACKIQRKKCSQTCVLAPYFPQNNPGKFLLVRRVFGNGHITKLLQDLPVEERGDAVNSMVYEASQRIKDPVHGCAGIINDLQKKVAELQYQLASSQTQELQTEQKELDDAVSNMVYEACPRFQDSVHGCVGEINDLKNKVAELELQLGSAQAELANMTMQHGNLLTILDRYYEDSILKSNQPVLDDVDSMELWDPLWT